MIAHDKPSMTEDCFVMETDVRQYLFIKFKGDISILGIENTIREVENIDSRDWIIEGCITHLRKEYIRAIFPDIWPDISYIDEMGYRKFYPVEGGVVSTKQRIERWPYTIMWRYRGNIPLIIPGKAYENTI